jgi:hypothetical protein
VESLYQQALQAPSLTLDSPVSGSSVSPLNVLFSASVTSQAGMVDSVAFAEGESLIATAEGFPYSAIVSAMAPGIKSVTARATYGDWSYEADSPAVTFTALPAPVPVVTIAASLPASKRGPVDGSFTITRDHPIGSISVPYTIAGTAVPGVDYTAISNNIALPDGVLSQTITVSPIAAAPDGISETVVLTLSASATHTLGSPSSASLTINDHITSIASGDWITGTTWNSAAAAPVSGTQNTGEGYSVANHVVTSNNPLSNSQALVAGSLRVKNGGTLDLARLHATTNQNVSYNLPTTSVESGGTIRFRCSTGSSTHTVSAALAFSGSTTLRLNAGGYDNDANLTGSISGNGTISLVSDASTGTGTFVRQLSVNSSNNPYSGNWNISHTGGGDETAALRAGAARALGSGTVTVGNASQLINDNATGLDSLSGIVLNGTPSTLLLNQVWTNIAANLSLTGGTPVVQLGNAASSIGNLSGSTGTIQGTGASSSLTVNQTVDRIFSGDLGANLSFTKSGAASLQLAGSLHAGVRLGLAQGSLSFAAPAAITSFNQSGGTCTLSLASPGTAPLALSGNLVRSGGSILVNPPSTPLIGVPYLLIAYQGTRSGQPPVIFSTPVDATIDYGSDNNSAITITFRNLVTLALASSPAEGGSTSGDGPYDVGTSATITATPAPNWQFVSWSGSGIADANSASTTVSIDAAKTVTANFERINAYAAWIDSFETITDPADKIPSADADDDGLANSIEFVIGADPSIPTAGPALEVELVSNQFVVRFTRVKAAGEAGFLSSIEVQDSLNPAEWIPAPEGNVTITDAGSVQTVTATFPVSGGSSRWFARLKVIAP